MRSSKKNKNMRTKGGPVLQDQANRQNDRYSYNQSEDSLAYNNYKKPKQARKEDPKL